ncbi:TPA: hypothetical protein ENX78_11810 [Candidatus Poribacteria bacterium]|nr:hypothetical protein [Candidatus Poribacteria bacterium]
MTLIYFGDKKLSREMIFGDQRYCINLVGNKKVSKKERKHVLRSLDSGIDWRKQVTSMEIPEGARGLGAMEGNESNLFADRMKGRGMSWTISGARRIGKAIELTRNGELSNFVGRRPTMERREDQSISFDIFRYKDVYTEQASMPSFHSQHASRAWVRALKELITLNYLLN